MRNAQMIVRYMRAIRNAIPISKLYRDTDSDHDSVSVSVSGYKLYPILTSLVYCISSYILYRYYGSWLNFFNVNCSRMRKIQVIYISSYFWLMACGSLFRTKLVLGNVDIVDDNYDIQLFGYFPPRCGREWKHTTFICKRCTFSFRYNGKDFFT